MQQNKKTAPQAVFFVLSLGFLFLFCDWLLLWKDVYLLSFDDSLRYEEIVDGRRYLCTDRHPVLHAISLGLENARLHVVRSKNLSELSCLWLKRAFCHDKAEMRVVLASCAL